MTSISSNGVISDFASKLGTVQQKLLQKFGKLTETVFSQESKFFGDLKYFQKERESIEDELCSSKPSF